MRYTLLAVLALALAGAAAGAGCGDGVCDETCSSCPQDCGPCQPYGVIRTCVEPHTFALTFDDGPAAPTSRLLDILAQEGVKATFFVIGMQAYDYGMSAVMARAVDEGHYMASHSYTHPSLPSLSAAGIRQEMRAAEDAVRSATCVNPRIMRPPYGETSGTVLSTLNAMGYAVVNWNLDTQDWQATGSQIYQNVVNGLNSLTPNSIVHLAHDRIAHSVEEVPRVIAAIRQRGYRFVTIDDCIYGSGSNPSRDFQLAGCARCGNGRCEAAGGESCLTCPGDCSCGFVCGDGVCSGGETASVCPGDCGGGNNNGGGNNGGGNNGGVSTDGRCGPNTDNNLGCPAGQCCSEYGWCGGSAEYCGSNNGGNNGSGFCGDGVCNSGEDCSWCPGDCCSNTVVCGDGTCSETESCNSCAADCGECNTTPDPVCGDDSCNGDESCQGCPSDCGPCQSDRVFWCANENHYALVLEGGPSALTPQLLDTLAAKEALASWVLTGQDVTTPTGAAMAQRIAAEGHWIATKGHTGANLDNLTPEELRNEMAAGDAALQAATCMRPRMLFEHVAASTEQSLNQLGYKVVYENYEVTLTEHTSAADVLAAVYAHLHPGSAPSRSQPSVIHVQPDISGITAGTLAAIIDMVREAGMELVTLGECVHGSAANAFVQFEAGQCAAGYCGDGTCSATNGFETCTSCPNDCPACAVCGDGVCDRSESCTSCCQDCGSCTSVNALAVSSNGKCGSNHADGAWCPEGQCCSQWGWCGSSPSYCNANSQVPDGAGGTNDDGGATTDDGGAGTGTDDGGTGTGTDTCPALEVCGNGICDAASSEDCTSCASDCGACGDVCGDGVCGATEDCNSCSADCGQCGNVCGDSTCQSAESCTSCAVDCGVCPPVCGDGVCQSSAPASETCSSCAADCGSCGGGSTECSGCWAGTSGPCQAASTVCFGYFPGTTMCPPGTAACAGASAANAASLTRQPFALVDTTVTASANLTRWTWTDASSATLTAAAATAAGVSPAAVRVVALQVTGAELGATYLRVTIMVELTVDDVHIDTAALNQQLSSLILAQQLSNNMDVAVSASSRTVGLGNGAKSSTGGLHGSGQSLDCGDQCGAAPVPLSSTTLLLAIGAAVVVMGVVGFLVVRSRSTSGGSSSSSSSAGSPRNQRGQSIVSEVDDEERAIIDQTSDSGLSDWSSRHSVHSVRSATNLHLSMPSDTDSSLPGASN